jgi:hypothetical protein
LRKHQRVNFSDILFLLRRHAADLDRVFQDNPKIQLVDASRVEVALPIRWHRDTRDDGVCFSGNVTVPMTWTYDLLHLQLVSYRGWSDGQVHSATIFRHPRQIRLRLFANDFINEMQSERRAPNANQAIVGRRALAHSSQHGSNNVLPVAVPRRVPWSMHERSRGGSAALLAMATGHGGPLQWPSYDDDEVSFPMPRQPRQHIHGLRRNYGYEDLSRALSNPSPHFVDEHWIWNVSQKTWRIGGRYFIDLCSSLA